MQSAKLLSLLVSLATLSACKSDPGEAKPEAQTEAKDAKEPAAKSADPMKAADKAPAPSPTKEGTAEDQQAPKPAGENEAATGGTENAAKEEATGTTGEAADPSVALLETIASTRKPTAEAKKAFEEAKALEVEPRLLAEATLKRGKLLIRRAGQISDENRAQSTMDAAMEFYELARGADPEFPDPSFELAKVAATRGEIDRAKELLLEVKERGGKKLLRNLEIDPTFALLIDDPQVQKLYQ